MDILTIGQCTTDLYMRVPSKRKVDSLVEEGNKMCFFHGSKIEIEKFEISPGGNPLNVAIGTATLGLKTQIYTEMGNDEYTQPIIKLLKDSGVDTKLCIKNKDRHNNVSSIIVHEGERTIFAYHEKQEYVQRDWGTPKMIYYTSMPEGYEKFQIILRKYVEENKNTILAFNPGSVQLDKGVKSLKVILEVTDILFVNKEEAIFLTKEAPLEKLHKQLQDLGPKLTVITNGKEGASASANGKMVNVKAYTDKGIILDKTGAGDAFSSGFLSAIHYNKSLKEALLWGAANAGSVIKEIGAVKGLLEKELIEAIVKGM